MNLNVKPKLESGILKERKQTGKRTRTVELIVGSSLGYQEPGLIFRSRTRTSIFFWKNQTPSIYAWNSNCSNLFI